MINRKSEVKVTAIYGRVSDEDSARNLHGSLEQQHYIGLERARQLSSESGCQYDVKYVLIEQKAITGGHARRPEFQKLLDLIRLGKIQAVISKELSRLSRSVLVSCELLELANKHNVEIHVGPMIYKPNDPASTMMFQVIASTAEWERGVIRQRTSSSMRSAALNNKKIPGGKLWLGFDPDPERRGFWIPNQEELSQVIFCMNRFCETLSYKETLQAMHKMGIKNKKGTDFTRSSLKRMFQSQKYLGRMRVPSEGPDEVWVDLPYGEVVPRALWDRVQKCIAKVEDEWGRSNRQAQRIYILSGLLQCPDGSTFYGVSANGRGDGKYYYYKNAQREITLHAQKLEDAVLRTMRIFENDKRMIEIVSEIRRYSVGRLDFVERQLRETSRALAGIDEEEKNLSSKLSLSNLGSEKVTRWLESQLEGFDQRRKSLQETQRGLELERESLQGSALDAKALKYSLRVLFDRFEKSDRAVQRGILREVIRRIVVHENNQIEVQWVFPAA